MKNNNLLFLITFLLIILSSCDKKKDNFSEKITINFWNLETPGDNLNIELNSEIISKIESEFPNIKINYLAMDGDSYKTKINTILAAGTPPDIFYTWLPNYSKSFVDSGKILKLNDYLSENALNNLNKNVLDSGNTLFDGIYAIPIEFKMAVLYSNKLLFDKYKIEIPKNYEELINVIDEFNKNGIQPILAPGKRLWPIMWLYDILAIKSIGVEDSMNALTKRISFNQVEFFLAAEKLKELVDHKAFVKDSVFMDNNRANELFLNGEIPMYFMGSWFTSEIITSNHPVSGHVEISNFPGLYNGFDKHMLGGTGDGYMVSNSSNYKKESVLVLERFIELKSQSDAVLFSAWNKSKNKDNLHPLLSNLNRVYNESEGFIIWWDTYMDSIDAIEHKNLCIKLFTNTISPIQFIKEMENISNNK